MTTNTTKPPTPTPDYLIGRDLLVSPVTAPGVRARDIYLPDNTLGWYDYYSGMYYSGGQTLHVQTPLEHLQLYVRAGSILAEGALMHADSADADTERTLRL